MRIIFDFRNVGMGNNGGTLTVVKSANTLVEMGHDVFIIDSFRNQHTWNKLNAEHIIPKNNNRIPDADIIIATGYKSVSTTVTAPGRCGLKVHWIRGWETWQLSEKQIVERVLSAPTLKLVNSICLQNKLKQFNFDSTIIRPGYDYEELYPLPKTAAWANKDFVVLGGLYTEGKHVPIKRPGWIFHVADVLNKKYKNVVLTMFGAPKIMKVKSVKFYYSNPSIEEKLKFYNQIDIWLAPTRQEGLHMPPAEAMMTECPVIATNAEMSGTQDYMVHGATGLVSENNLDSFLECTEILYKNSYYRTKAGQEARKQIIRLGSRKENMRKFVNLISGII